MAEYITKEQAELIVESALREYIRTGAVETAFEKLYSLPDADVVEVVHGHWIGTWGDGYANGFIVYEEFECSRCGCVHRADGEPTWDYCPQCGARMGGGADQ